MNYRYPYLNNAYGCSYLNYVSIIMDSHNGLHILLSTIEQTYLPTVQLWISIIQLWLSVCSICVIILWFLPLFKKIKGVRFSGNTVIIISMMKYELQTCGTGNSKCSGVNHNQITIVPCLSMSVNSSPHY